MRRVLRVINCCLALLIASCVTVNVYFPAAAVQKAADEIVGEVQGKEAAPTPEPEPSSWLRQQLKRVSLSPSEAYAQVDIKISTPAIRALKDSLRNRFEQVRPLLDKGAIGETNNGLFELKETGALSLQERGQAAALVQQENSDRMALYREIAGANKLGPESIPQIQKIFASAWRDHAHPGWWVQDDTGAWQKKK